MFKMPIFSKLFKSNLKNTPFVIKSKKIDYAKELEKILKTKKVKISALIPAYNEGPRIENVLETVCEYPYISQIVVINDGSKDDTASKIRNFAKKCKKIKFVNLKKNRGKTGAILEGVKRVTGNLVVMLDADIKNLKHKYLDKMLYLVASKEYDLVILDRFTDRMSPFGLMGITRVLGGERAFWLDEFKKIDLKSIKNYQLEVTINMHYIRKDKKVRTVLAPDLEASWQIRKWGLVTGIKSYLKEYWEVYRKSGVRNFYIQVTEMEDDPIVEVYTWYQKAKNQKMLKELARAGVFLTTTVVSVGLMAYFASKFTRKQVKGKLQKTIDKLNNIKK